MDKLPPTFGKLNGYKMVSRHIELGSTVPLTEEFNIISPNFFFIEKDVRRIFKGNDIYEYVKGNEGVLLLEPKNLRIVHSVLFLICL